MQLRPRAFLPLTVLLATVAPCGWSQSSQSSTTSSAVRLPAPGGAIVASDSAQFRRQYGEWHYAPTRISGDLVVISGVVALVPPDGHTPLTSRQLEDCFRSAWARIGQLLGASGSSFHDVVEISSFHVLTTPLVAGTAQDHLESFRRVKDEFVFAPYPSWTGVGVAALFAERGLAEIRVMARIPARPSTP